MNHAFINNTGYKKPSRRRCGVLSERSWRRLLRVERPVTGARGTHGGPGRRGGAHRGRSFTDTRGWGSPGRAGRGAGGRGDSGSSRCYSPGCRPRERERGPPTQRARPPGNILEGRGPRGLPSSPALHAALAWAGDTCARELLCPGGTGRVAVLWLKGSAGRPWGGPSERRATGDTWTPHGGRRGAA